MDEAHLRAAIRYVSLNPVRAKLVSRAQDWPWSSVHALLGRADSVTDSAPVLSRYPDIAGMIDSGPEDTAEQRLSRAATIGRPVGDATFLRSLEQASGRTLPSWPSGPYRPKSGSDPVMWRLPDLGVALFGQAKGQPTIVRSRSQGRSECRKYWRLSLLQTRLVKAGDQPIFRAENERGTRAAFRREPRCARS